MRRVGRGVKRGLNPTSMFEKSRHCCFKREMLIALERAVAMPDYGKCNAIAYSSEGPPERVNPIDACATQWFALAVKPRCDKAVARVLDTKEFQTFLPLYKKRHEYATRCKEFDLPLFPGYVFCRFNALARLPILTTPGVIQILGVGNTPIPLSDSEIASLQIAMKAQRSLQPFPFVQVGQRVRINRGALAGVEGIVIKVKHSVRLVLSITLLQRSVVLEIDHDQISANEIL